MRRMSISSERITMYFSSPIPPKRSLLPITSFGHSLVHAALAKTETYGMMGIFMGMFDLTATGITLAIVFSFIFSLLFKPKN